MPNNESQNNDIIEWSYKKLVSLGYTLKSNSPEKVLSTPWSYVARFDTSEGSVYLKHTPELIALEANIIQILHDEFHASVPKIIAHNPSLNCFLMKDAGQSLRAILKNNFDTSLVCKSIDQFTSLQIAVADNINLLLDIGIPDWRLDKLPHLYNKLLLEKELLIADGLSESEIIELEALFPKVSGLCKKLSEYDIKETMVQPDFNDNNTLIAESSHNLTMIDLGEVVISHPFFSALNFLLQMKKHHGLTDKDATYLIINDACFKNFINLKTKNQIVGAIELTEILWPVYWALANYRLMLACGKEKMMAFQLGRLSHSLKEFIAACKKINGTY